MIFCLFCFGYYKSLRIFFPCESLGCNESIKLEGLHMSNVLKLGALGSVSSTFTQQWNP